MNWAQSVDEASCFTWIEGVRKSINQESCSIQFSRRKPNIIWSSMDIEKIERLAKKDLIHPQELASFRKRSEHNSKIYSYE
ncbi:MAG: hypothetical protein ABI288_04565 [Ginsengibacter sp.]